ncbi:MAG: cytochrome c3 family protein [Pseudomonadota bacterium]
MELFNKEGKKIGQEGTAYLGCTTCHNPHLGNKRFLKEYNEVSTFCASCHRDEGLTRYKFFHQDTYRKK